MKRFKLILKDGMGRTVRRSLVFAKGKNAAHELFLKEIHDAKIPYSHDYTWDITLDENQIIRP